VLNDYLLLDISFSKFDLVIGNPPYCKIKPKDKNSALYQKKSDMRKTTNLFAYFFEKALKDATYVSLIVPKSILNAFEYFELRDILKKFEILNITDLGETVSKGKALKLKQ
jgi:DNA (cytosine-5)-methyltransferase 1